MYAKNENERPGDRAALVDEVMDLPEVKASDRVEATVPVPGDAVVGRAPQGAHRRCDATGGRQYHAA